MSLHAAHTGSDDISRITCISEWQALNELAQKKRPSFFQLKPIRQRDQISSSTFVDLQLQCTLHIILPLSHGKKHVFASHLTWQSRPYTWHIFTVVARKHDDTWWFSIFLLRLGLTNVNWLMVFTPFLADKHQHVKGFNGFGSSEKPTKNTLCWDLIPTHTRFVGKNTPQPNRNTRLHAYVGINSKHTPLGAHFWLIFIEHINIWESQITTKNYQKQLNITKTSSPKLPKHPPKHSQHLQKSLNTALTNLPNTPLNTIRNSQKPSNHLPKHLTYY